MTDLNAEDRGLLDMARDGHEPTDADRGRLRARLAAELGVAAGLIATTATVGTSAGATGFASAGAGGLASAGSAGLASAGSAGLASAGSTSTGLAVGGGAATLATPATLATLSTAKVMAAVLLSGVVGGGGVAAYHAARSARTEVAPRAPLVMAAMSPELIEARRSHTQQAAGPPALATSSRQIPATLDVPSGAIDSPPDRPSAAGTISADVPPQRTAPPIPPARSARSPRRERAPDEFRADRDEAQLPANPRPPIEAGRSATAPPPWEPPIPSIGQPSLPRDPRGTPASLGIASAPRSPSILESETRLVAAGVAALHAGDAARALTLLDQHARAYPNGVLAEERAAERVAALCALGRGAEAREARAAFLREHLRSPLSARVRDLCGVPSNP